MPRGVALALAGLGAALAVLLFFTLRDDGPVADGRLPPAPAPAPSAKRKPWVTPAPEPTAAPGDAALWLRRQWLHAEPTDSELAALTAALAAAGVTRVYPFLGPMNEMGVPGWRSLGVHTPWSASSAERFLKAMPGALPWTGGVAVRDVHWADEAQQQAFAAELARVVALGAGGVHINIEPVGDGDEAFVKLLTRVRAVLPAGTELSVAVVAPRNERIEVGAIRYWSMAYLARVCGPADELVVMGYDTWLTDAAAYQRLVADWTEQLAKELPPDCAWRMGVPTYDDDIPHHKLDVERIDVALRGVREGLARLEAPPPAFRGIALYASWTTDEQEWAAYDALWRGRAPTARVIPEPVR